MNAHPDQIDSLVANMIPEAAANAYITPTPEVTGPTGQEGKQIPSPREIANRLKWLYELIKKIRETFRSFRMRDLK